ncbi:MAG TPA: galactose-1-phosphate uridylyltransferase [Kofleriaceae bacterium]|nr:galactose-1-phosphate uridylyltransferase [Kofleriaceae bacterium]
MHKRVLQKPDGRMLTLYARHPIDGTIEAPAAGQATRGGSHLRWHPLRGEWIVYAGHRQNRTFLPPPEWNPLAPATDPAHPTEVPAGPWDVAVFENLFSALGPGHVPAIDPVGLVDTSAGGGVCEVVVFTQDPKGSLGGLPLDHLELVIEVWADRTRALYERDDVQYVFPFENRGVEVGVTLHHPHGQIYAYPFVPPIAARQLESQHAYRERHGRGLVADLIAGELSADLRTLYVGEHAVAWVPVCARWAYEVWVAPRREVARLDALTDDERRDLARALKTALRKLDGLWHQPMPYVLAIYQAPARDSHGDAHVHVEILPWLRMKGRLKYLAGSEVGAGTFTADTLPEDKAAELRAVEVTL